MGDTSVNVRCPRPRRLVASAHMSQPSHACNPPFSQEGGGWAWIEKCFEEAQKGTEVVVLIN
eukprot:SAG11_NODE_10309_length_840_cov_2.993252_1_plen_61_part_10